MSPAESLVQPCTAFPGQAPSVEQPPANDAPIGFSSCAEAHAAHKYHLRATDNPQIEDWNSDGIVC